MLKVRIIALSALLLASCGDDPQPVGPEPIPSPSASPDASADCKVVQPLIITMKVEGESQRVFFLGQIPTFKANPTYRGELANPDFDTRSCPQPNIWQWDWFGEADCHRQGAGDVSSLILDCAGPGLLHVTACTIDSEFNQVCGRFDTEAKGE